mgnify:CR=1 FL=1
MKTILKNFVTKYKYILSLIVILIISLIINVCAIKSCSGYKEKNNNNIIALTDTIHYYKTKTGELVASKRLLEGDLTTLKLANDSLYHAIKDMKISDPSSVVYIETTIDNGKQDTLWRTDTIIPNLNINRNFAFNNEFRSLEGFVNVNDTALGLHIDKDQTFVNYVLAIEDNTVKVKSNNPYVKFNEIQGITIPEPKHKNWGFSIGPALYYGVNPVTRKSDYGIGISLVYGYRIK